MNAKESRRLCYVTYVSNTVIHMMGADRHWRARIRAAGLPYSWWSGGVPYPRNGDPDEFACEQAMILLARLGVCFAEDYKQGMAPADQMRDMQQRGVLKESFVAISWGGRGSGKKVVQPPSAM